MDTFASKLTLSVLLLYMFEHILGMVIDICGFNINFKAEAWKNIRVVTKTNRSGKLKCHKNYNFTKK